MEDERDYAEEAYNRELMETGGEELAPWWTGNTAEDLAGAMLDAARAEAENAFAPTSSTLAACRAVIELAAEFPEHMR